MNSLAESLYHNSPSFLQSIAISLYGYKLHSDRYGGASPRYTQDLFKSQWFSRDQIAVLQNAQLTALLVHAFETCPYYRNMFLERGLNPKDVLGNQDLEKIPITSKSDLRVKGDLLKSAAVPSSGMLEIHTSGTTGSPLTIYCDKDSRRRHYAFLNRFRSWFGVEVGMRRASFFGRVIVASTQASPPFWRYDLSENNYLFSSYHMSESTLPLYYKKLKEIEPLEISGYPSSLFTLAKYIVGHKLSPITPKFIMTTAETLLAQQRRVIEEAFACKVSDQYGCSEMAIFVSQCEQGRYHLNEDYGLVEVVDHNDKPVQPGMAGEVVCTSFINRAMPLIRYRLGDRVRLSSSSCGCGRAFLVVDQIEGRVDDVIVTPEGKAIGRLDPIFKDIKGIYESQIIQTSSEKVLVKIVVGQVFGAEGRDVLLSEIKKRVGYSMRVDLEVVDSIPKEANGKFKSVVGLNSVKKW